MTSAPSQSVYEFGGFRLDPRGRLLVGPNGPIAVTAKAFDALVYLVERSGQLVERRELIGALWPNTVVEDNNLNQAIVVLRRAFGEGFISTIPGRGYQFVAAVARVDLLRSDVAGAVAVAAGNGPAAAPAVPLVSEPTTAPHRVFERRLPGWVLRVAAMVLVVGLIAIVVAGFVRHEYPSSPAPARSIRLAILPFENLSPNPEDAFFTDGLHWEVLSAISNRAPGLDVVSRRTMLLYRAAAKPLTEVATELGATHVLEGSVRRSGEEVRLILQLSDGRSDKLVWSHDYPRMRQDVQALESEVADALAAQLLGSTVAPKLPQPPTNPDAYDSYLKGRLTARELSGYQSGSEWRAAETFFSDAISRDPRFWRAYLERAAVRGFLITGGYAKPADLGAAVKSDFDAAHRLAPDESQVLAAEAVREAETDPRRGLELFERAEARGLAEPDLVWPKVAILVSLERWPEAIALARRLAALDPANATQLGRSWVTFMAARAPVDGLRVMDLLLARQPNNGQARAQRLQTVFMFKGELEPWRNHERPDTFPAADSIDFEQGPIVFEVFKWRRFFGEYAALRAYLDQVKPESLRALSIREMPTAELRGWADLLLGEPVPAIAEGAAVRAYAARRAATDNDRWYVTLLAAEGDLFAGDNAQAIALAHQVLDLARTRPPMTRAEATQLATRVLAWSGAGDEAAGLLEQLAASTPGLAPALVTRDPLFAMPLAKNARYQALTKRLEGEMAALRLE